MTGDFSDQVYGLLDLSVRLGVETVIKSGRVFEMAWVLPFGTLVPGAATGPAERLFGWPVVSAGASRPLLAVRYAEALPSGDLPRLITPGEHLMRQVDRDGGGSLSGYHDGP